MAKKRMLDLVPMWKDRRINKDLKMKLVRSLVWTATVLTYGAEGWTLTKADEKRVESAESIVGCYESVHCMHIHIFNKVAVA